MDLLVINAEQIISCSGFSDTPQVGARFGELNEVRNGYVAVRGERIASIGPMDDCPPPSPHTRVINASQRAVLPGFVDAHTHVIYAGDRAHEFAQRLRGATYLEIAQAGGGILATVKQSRIASAEQLVTATLPRLNRMLQSGTTTAEVKSGYGLTLHDEIKFLQAMRTLHERHPIDIVPTFMGAHEIPPEYRHDTEAYVRLIIDEMLPQVGDLAQFNDVFCDRTAFQTDQCRRILEAGKRYGLTPKVHADEFNADLEAAQLAAEVGAISAEHLLHASADGLEALARAGTIAVCLPGTPFFLMMHQYPPVRRMMELGVPIALGSDCNPGSCPMESMGAVMGLACLQLRLSPAQALAAATINAAHAVNMAGEVGSLEPGKLADMLILSESSYDAIPYRWGSNLVETVIKRGQVVVGGQILSTS